MQSLRIETPSNTIDQLQREQHAHAHLHAYEHAHGHAQAHAQAHAHVHAHVHAHAHAHAHTHILISYCGISFRFQLLVTCNVFFSLTNKHFINTSLG